MSQKNNKVKTEKGAKISLTRKLNKIASKMPIEEVLERDTFGTNVGADIYFDKGGYVANKNYSILEELIYN